MRIVAGVLAMVAGTILFFLTLDLHLVARLSGLAIAVIGLIAASRAARLRTARTIARYDAAVSIVGGILLVILGAVISIWATGSLPLFANLVSVGVVAYGVLELVQAAKLTGALRIAGVMTALSAVILGVLSLTWPVLTVILVKWIVALWLVIFGLREVVGSIRAREARSAESLAATERTRVFKRTPKTWIAVTGGALALVVAGAFAATSHIALSGDSRPAPDSFYAAPESVPSQPGELIRSEPLTVGIPDGAKAWKILYSTTNPDNSPNYASGIVVAPDDRGDEPLPFLSVAHGTTGIVPKCAPSLSATPVADGAGTALTEMVTKHGWAAVISDYVGLGTEGPHPYLVGEVEARNVLDASRAADQLTELNLSTQTVLWGHSQGGHGSLWAGQIAPDYAPEFDVLGVAAFAPASNLYGLAEADKSEPAGKTVSAYIAASWNDYYPELKLSGALTPGSASGVDAIQQLCFNDRDALAALIRGTQVPDQVFPDSELSGSLGDFLKSNSPTGPFGAPVLVAQGLADPLVKPKLQDEWVKQSCDSGIPVDYRLYQGLGHVELVGADSPLTAQIVKWTEDRVSGGDPTPNCGNPSTY